MTEADWVFDESDGDLMITTGVAGRAAKMGHRLTIAMTRWRAAVSWTDGEPTAVRLGVDVDSFSVLSGAGGLTPLSVPEKALIRVNALKCLDGARHPHIEFDCEDVASTATDAGYRLAGTLTLHGKARRHALDVRVDDLGDRWLLQCDTTVRHSDHGIKPYSMLMGSMRVADDVTVTLRAERAKNR